MINSCNFGEICIRSIDGLSYNCVEEADHNKKSIERFYNQPLNYFVKFHEINPCISSPCGEKQICRVLNRNKFVCVRELELPYDISNPTIIESKFLKNKIFSIFGLNICL